MSVVAKALAVRLFATPLLAAKSVLVLASLCVFLYQTPFILVFVAKATFFAGAYIVVFTIYVLVFFIIPSLLIGAGGIAVLVTLLMLFCRGYLSVSIYYLNWLCKKCQLIQEDIALNNFFAGNSPLDH